MVKFRLNERNINRLLVFLALIAPWLYLFGSYFTYLCGAHGNASVPSVEQFFTGNWFYTGGLRILQGNTFFFAPFDTLLKFISDNMFNLNNELGRSLTGYLSYVFMVVSVDLFVYIALFIPRIFKKLISMLEGGLKND